MKIDMPEQVKYIIEKLKNNDCEAYVVGGCVRDSLLGREPKDWDITTPCNPYKVMRIFEKEGYTVIPTGIKHGTVTVVIDDVNYEITTYRSDGKYTNGRKPDEVHFTNSLSKDLARRDFTINAMAYNDEKGLIDYHDGLIHLQEKIIKCVGNPHKRFKEDELRKLRAIRFACTLGFDVDDEAMRAIMTKVGRIYKLSSERIRSEFDKILLSDNACKGLRVLYHTGILSVIMPEFARCYGFEQKNVHHDKDVFEHTLSVIKNTPKDLEMRLSALFHDIGKPNTFSIGEDGQGHFYNHANESCAIATKIMRRLKYDNKTIKYVRLLVMKHMIPADIGRTGIKRLLVKMGEEHMFKLTGLVIADRLASASEYSYYDDIIKIENMVKEILVEEEPMSISDLEINGYTMLELGYKPSKEMGIVMKEMLELVMNDASLNTAEYLTEYAKNKLN